MDWTISQHTEFGALQGLSTELGAFVAGVMLSTTDQQEHALHQLEQVCAVQCKNDASLLESRWRPTWQAH
jgi:hypothetical protein